MWWLCRSMEALCCTQVFEYLTTDLKKFMDSTGKGPKSAPMPTMQIKVSSQLCKMPTRRGQALAFSDGYLDADTPVVKRL